MKRCRFCGAGDVEKRIRYKGYYAFACKLCKKKIARWKSDKFFEIFEKGELKTTPINIKEYTKISYCEVCGKVYPQHTKRDRFCGKDCLNEFHRTSEDYKQDMRQRGQKIRDKNRKSDIKKECKE